MSTSAQITANRANSLHSTGPKTDQGKAEACLNNLCHGLAGAFTVLAWEDQEAYDSLLLGFKAEHRPSTFTETLLVEKLAQHYWLARRALTLQEMCFSSEMPLCDDDEGAGRLLPVARDQERQLALYLRYQTTHDRAFHKCLNQLLSLRAEKRKQEIGFESQERRRNNDEHKRSDQARKQEMHVARLRAVNAKTDEREIDNDIRQTIEAPLPGNVRLPFDTLKDVFRIAACEVNRQLKSETAA